MSFLLFQIYTHIICIHIYMYICTYPSTDCNRYWLYLHSGHTYSNNNTSIFFWNLQKSSVSCWKSWKSTEIWKNRHKLLLIYYYYHYYYSPKLSKCSNVRCSMASWSKYFQVLRNSTRELRIYFQMGSKFAVVFFH